MTFLAFRLLIESVCFIFLSTNFQLVFMPLSKEQIAQRIARELQDGYYVNLGIGIPTLVANYIPAGIHVELQSENGLLGMGPFPFQADNYHIAGFCIF